MAKFLDLERAAEATLENGFAVIPNFFTDIEAAQLRAELETHEDFKEQSCFVLFCANRKLTKKSQRD
jgi:hypothetical protein